MKQSYDLSLKELLKHEGGYSNHPSDPGGPTNYGITLSDYKRYINQKGTAEDVKHMTLEQAKSIYKSKYWDALNCDNLPVGVDYTVFDYGVNSGVARARRVLAKAPKDPRKAIIFINDERLAFLKGLKTWPVFKGGWSTRVADVKALSLKMHDGVKPPAGSGTAIAVATAGVAAAATAPNYAPYIFVGAVVMAVAGYFIVKFFKERK